MYFRAVWVCDFDSNSFAASFRSTPLCAYAIDSGRSSLLGSGISRRSLSFRTVTYVLAYYFPSILSSRI